MRASKSSASRKLANDMQPHLHDSSYDQNLLLHTIISDIFAPCTAHLFSALIIKGTITSDLAKLVRFSAKRQTLSAERISAEFLAAYNSFWSSVSNSFAPIYMVLCFAVARLLSFAACHFHWTKISGRSIQSDNWHWSLVKSYWIFCVYMYRTKKRFVTLFLCCGRVNL